MKDCLPWYSSYPRAVEENEEIRVVEKDYDLTKILMQVRIPCVLALLLRYKKQKLSLRRRREGGFDSVFITFCELLMLFCD